MWAPSSGTQWPDRSSRLSYLLTLLALVLYCWHGHWDVLSAINNKSVTTRRLSLVSAAATATNAAGYSCATGFFLPSAFVRIYLCICNALTFGSLNLQSSFLIGEYVFRIFRSCSFVRVIESRSKSQEHKSVPVLLLGFKFQMHWPRTFVFDLQV